MDLIAFLIAFLIAVAFGSFMEWVVHKHFMHSIKWMRTPHQRHAVEHHAERRAPGKYYAKTDELKQYHLFETSFMPILWILHFPLYSLIYATIGPWASLGMAAGTAFYVFGYESLHWYIHCPDQFPWRDARWFQFLSEHHRLHHNKADINYNVVLPLADWALGTLSMTHTIRPEPEDVRRGTAPPPQEKARNRASVR